MKTSQRSDFNYSEMLEAIQMLGFEQIEMNFFRRMDIIETELGKQYSECNSQLVLYAELTEDKVRVHVYEDAISIDYRIFKDPLSFIDFVESTLESHGIESVALTPIDSSIIVNRKTIVAADNRISTKDMLKKMLRVKSSNLWSYAFQPKDYNTGTMVIQFKGPNGGPQDAYVYYDVPNKLWQKFVAAPSKGHFFWQHIRNIFKYGKLTGDKRTKLPNGV